MEIAYSRSSLGYLLGEVLYSPCLKTPPWTVRLADLLSTGQCSIRSGIQAMLSAWYLTSNKTTDCGNRKVISEHGYMEGWLTLMSNTKTLSWMSHSRRAISNTCTTKAYFLCPNKANPFCFFISNSSHSRIMKIKHFWGLNILLFNISTCYVYYYFGFKSCLHKNIHTMGKKVRRKRLEKRRKFVTNIICRWTNWWIWKFQFLKLALGAVNLLGQVSHILLVL